MDVNWTCVHFKIYTNIKSCCTPATYIGRLCIKGKAFEIQENEEKIRYMTENTRDRK